MELYQVRYFIALCETLNFTRAAERCNVSQPSLTRAIQNLEAEFGGPLFHRERQNTHLTDLGQMVRPYLDEVSQQAEAARERARQYAKLTDTPLTVGLMCTIGPSKLVPLFAEFQRRYPGVDIALRDARAEVLRENLAKGELDLAVFGQPDPLDDRFNTLELFREPFVIGFARGHPFEPLNAVRLMDLHQMRYLSRANCEFADYMRAMCRERGIEPLRPYRSERDDWIQAMALAGLGFTFIPQFAVTVADLIVRPLIEPEVERTVNLVTVRGRPHGKAVGAFVRTAMALRGTL